MNHEKIKLKEKIAYALGDGAANIAWRGVAFFLLVFYTDVYGLAPAVAGAVLFVARFSDGISDVVMGVIGDRTKSKHGHFRPWILWTAIPLAVSLSLLFTTPDLGETGKIIYAFTTYIIFTLIYTANNIPYGALMAVITGDHQERTNIGSFRMVGAFGGGILVQGALLFLIMTFGNVNPHIEVKPIASEKYELLISAPIDVPNANIRTKKEVATFLWLDNEAINDEPTQSKSFKMEAGELYKFRIEGEANITTDKIVLIDQKKGYRNSIYLMSMVLAILLLFTFLGTRERVTPPAEQRNDLWKDLKQLIKNKAWLILLIVGLLFNIYNAMKQGITVIYFSHYIHSQLLAISYLTAIGFAAVAGAMITSFLSKRIGKKSLFIYALLFSGTVNSLIIFCQPGDIVPIFILGVLSDMSAAIFPTLFFVMLGDAADYSEWKNGRRATGLIYSAGSFATKFGGGIAGAMIGLVLGFYNYNGQDVVSIQNAIPGIKMLMSWIPATLTAMAALVMLMYPLTQPMMDTISLDLNNRRKENS